MVIYQTDSGSASARCARRAESFGCMHDGMVLRQETWLFGSRLAFVRMSPDESAKLTAAWTTC